jgi:SAM-dependent methyltransferase
LGHALEALFRQKSKPEILDLGPLCGDTLVYLADRGARVAVEEFDRPPPRDEADPEAPPPDPLSVDQPDERFDLVLAWEQFDFVDDQSADELAAEVRRVLAPGGRLLMIAMNNSPTSPVTSGRPARYRLTGDDQVVREELPGEPLRRWCRPTRDIERALAPLKVEKLHLHRNQTREFLAIRPAASKTPKSGPVLEKP